MPARKRAPVFCTCTACRHYSGHSEGVAFPSKIERTAHLARLKLEREATNGSDASAYTQLTEEDIQAAGAEVFVSTLLDDGPNVGSQTSSDESSSTRRLPDAPCHAISIGDIIDGVSRLALPHGIQDPSSSSKHPTISPSARDSPGSSECSSTAQSPIPSTSHLPPPSPLEKNYHRKGRQPLQSLTDMKIRLSTVQEKPTMPSHDILCEAESDTTAVRQALENLQVPHRTHSVDSQEQSVFETLEILQTRITELRNAIPDTRCSPVEFDSSKGSHAFDCSMLTIVNYRPPLRISCRRVHLRCASLHLFGSCFGCHYGG
jgi:hypothetical protein